MHFTDLLGRLKDVSGEPDGGYLARCPAHSDTKPSLRIWRGDDLKVRLHCRAGCDTKDVVKALGLKMTHLRNMPGEGRTVSSARPARVGPGPTAALRMYLEATGFHLLDFASEVGGTARAYIADRFGLDLNAAADFMLGVDDGTVGETFPYLSRTYREHPRLTVPLRDFDGVARGLQGRDLTGQCPARWVSLTNPEGQRWTPYGVFRGGGGYGVVIITEGPSDALTVAAVGYDAVAVRGASLAGNPELAAELAAGLKGAHVIVAGDHDPAGQGFTRRLADALQAHGIDVHTLTAPQAGDDLNAWRMRDPGAFPDALHAAVKAARPVQDPAEAQAQAVSAELEERTGADYVTRGQGGEAARLLAALVQRYGESDAMNAHALAAWTDGSIRYAQGLGYLIWNGHVWERSDIRVRQEVHRMGAALVLAGETEKARGFTMTTRIKNLLTELRSVPTVNVDASEFDARPELLSFRNGTVDLRTGQLRPHDKGDMITYALDLDYVLDARADRWESFLAEIFPDNPEMPAYLQRLIGYGITGHVSEQAFCVLWGKGANGKSVLTDTLTTVFREISKTTPFSTFEERNNGGIPNDVAALRGSRLVMASEGDSGKAMSESVLKRVTGKDMVSARFLRQEFFEFKPSFLLFLASNHKPKFKGQDEGLWRRVKLLPFTRWFAPHERDYGLDVKLLDEAEGIAAWAVRGAVEWFRGGLQDPDVIKTASREYRETSDALAGFFPGVLEPASDTDLMNGTEAFNAYLDWCSAENLPDRERWTRRAFYSAMEERGVTRKKTSQGIALVGVREVSTPATANGSGIFAR